MIKPPQLLEHLFREGLDLLRIFLNVRGAGDLGDGAIAVHGLVEEQLGVVEKDGDVGEFVASVAKAGEGPGG